MPTFHEHYFIKARSNLILSYSSREFLYVFLICIRYSVGRRKEWSKVRGKKREGGRVVRTVIVAIIEG